MAPMLQMSPKPALSPRSASGTEYWLHCLARIAPSGSKIDASPKSVTFTTASGSFEVSSKLLGLKSRWKTWFAWLCVIAKIACLIYAAHVDSCSQLDSSIRSIQSCTSPPWKKSVMMKKLSLSSKTSVMLQMCGCCNSCKALSLGSTSLVNCNFAFFTTLHVFMVPESLSLSTWISPKVQVPTSYSKMYFLSSAGQRRIAIWWRAPRSSDEEALSGRRRLLLLLEAGGGGRGKGAPVGA
mmetsp:Transcript_25532/g.64336  ORF Transcript_25532/g.64336 Transcript_25532/m.64336 type:complete len:239 (-) Transcript_25532:2-718(-)